MVRLDIQIRVKLLSAAALLQNGNKKNPNLWNKQQLPVFRDRLV